MSTYLDDLIAGAHRRVDAARAQQSDSLMLARVSVNTAPTLQNALAGPDVSIIAEIKRASPSRGPLALNLDVSELARSYMNAGAAAISVLTEPEGFRGSLDDLAQVSSLGAPSLRKDFIVDRYQVWEARAAGAVGVLLIVAALDAGELRDLIGEIIQLGMTPLVEVHDEFELDVALEAGASVVGINARDLRTFEIDRSAFERIRPKIPAGVIAVAESGVRDANDVRGYADAGAHAVLVGESLVTSADPAQALHELVAEGKAARRHATASHEGSHDG